MAKSRKSGRSKALTSRWDSIKEHAREIKASFRARYELRRVDHDIADDSDLIDVDEEIRFEFEGTYSRQTVELAARSLRKHEWVVRGHPRQGHPARANPRPNSKPRLGRARELRARADLVGQLQNLRSALRDYTEAIGPIGSNDTSGTLQLDTDIPPPRGHSNSRLARLRGNWRHRVRCEQRSVTPVVGFARGAAHGDGSEKKRTAL